MQSHLIVKTPLRVSLLGGGADFKKYIEKKPRFVLGMGINYYIHLNAYSMPGIFQSKSRFQYSKTEEFDDPKYIEHPVIRNVIIKYGLTKNINASIASDMPSGCGLGSSSAFTCGMINLINTHNGNMLTSEELAYETINLEQNILKENVGIQDQILCSLGGIKLIKLSNSNFETIISQKINILLNKMLKNRSFLVYTKITRESSECQSKSDLNPNKESLVNSISDIADEFANNYSKTIDIWSLLKECVIETWNLKKKFALNKNRNEILKISEKCLETGAEFIKLLGAGDGGFIYCSVPEEKQEKFINSFDKNTVFKIEPSLYGSQVQNTFYS